MVIYCLYSKCFSFSFNKVKNINMVGDYFLTKITMEYLLGKITIEEFGIKLKEVNELIKELNKKI